MAYIKVWIRGLPEVFTWYDPQNECSLGQRVLVPFRNTQKIGYVVAIESKKPDFRCRKFTEILKTGHAPSHFLPYIRFLQWNSVSAFERVMKMAVPRYLCEQKEPKFDEEYYILAKNVDFDAIKGKNQQKVLSILATTGKPTPRSTLLGFVSGASITNLAKKGLILHKKPDFVPYSFQPRHVLTQKQAEVAEGIVKSTKPCLLYGVTGAGKTDVYLKIIDETLKNTNNGQFLLCVPEIALTPQLFGVISGAFVGQVGVMHSEMTPKTRAKVWDGVAKGNIRIVVGTRSALLLPFLNLKGIILDEEHDSSYKNEQNPRYFGHDAALWYAKNGCTVVFGSATPRITSFLEVGRKNWDMFRLDKRIHDSPWPEVMLVDAKNHALDLAETGISNPLKEKIVETIHDGKQVLLFLNKRGQFQKQTCQTCAHTAECSDCSVVLKVHHRKSGHYLQCHLCGRKYAPLSECPQCNSHKWTGKTPGTQKIEAELKHLFPNFNILRADRDTITKKQDLQKIITKIEEKKADILLGTQMITKGLDLSNIGLVGLLNADTGLSIPHFRAEERIGQLLRQVMGRGGRKGQSFSVLVQTYTPERRIWTLATQKDLSPWFKKLATDRKNAHMPPYSALIRFLFKDESEKHAEAAANRWKTILESHFPYKIQVLPALTPKQKTKHIFWVNMWGLDRKAMLEDVWKLENVMPEGMLVDSWV